MKQMLTLLVLAVGMVVPVSSFAQAVVAHDHRQDSAPQAAATLTEGEVKKIDQDNGKITIKHGNIQHLDMPSMTMVFSAKDKNLLSHVKPGDKIQFMAVSEGGKLVVTEIQPVR